MLWSTSQDAEAPGPVCDPAPPVHVWLCGIDCRLDKPMVREATWSVQNPQLGMAHLTLADPVLPSFLARSGFFDVALVLPLVGRISGIAFDVETSFKLQASSKG